MSEGAAPDTSRVASTAPKAAPGTTFFGLMAATWSAFFTLLAASPETLADVYDWLTGLALVWEVLMWIVLLPWALTYLVWESSWDRWLRVGLVVLFGVAHLAISAPRQKGRVGVAKAAPLGSLVSRSTT